MSGHIIYLSPTRAIYQNEKVAQGLAGMTQWLFKEGDTEREILQRIWNNYYRAIDPQVEIHLLKENGKSQQAMRRSLIVNEWVDGEFLTTPSAVVSTMADPEVEWKVRLIHPRKGNTKSGDWMYLSLFLNDSIRIDWQRWKNVTATDPNTGRPINEIIVPILYPADQWDGKHLRKWYHEQGRVPPLTAMHRHYMSELNQEKQRLQQINTRLRNAKYGPSQVRLSQEHAQAIKKHDNEKRRSQARIHKLETEYQKNLWDVAKQNHIANRLILERGWKAMMIAGMQVMQLNVTIEDPDQ